MSATDDKKLLAMLVHRGLLDQTQAKAAWASSDPGQQLIAAGVCTAAQWEQWRRTDAGTRPELSRYEIGDLLGQGGTARVFRARDKTSGAHPYLVTPEHTAQARKILGPGKVLAPEQGAVLESWRPTARALARGALDDARSLPNDANNWKRLGLTDEDIANASDRLLDALFAWGGVDEIAARVKAHHDAGADHVCLQLISASGLDGELDAWRKLAKAVL